MTTTNMFLNFGGKWDSPECREYSDFDIYICGIVDIKSETELENEIVGIEDPIKYPVRSHKLKILL